MKKYRNLKSSLLMACASAMLLTSMSPLFSAEKPSLQPGKIGVINFKDCVERSKLGQQEQNSFEALKKQAELKLQEKEKNLRELAAKLEDSDYLDSLTPEAEADLKHKFRFLNQELAQHQQSLYQTLSQANFKIVQKLTEAVNEAASDVAGKNKLSLVINEDACFFYDKSLDVTDMIVEVLDGKLDKSK